MPFSCPLYAVIANKFKSFLGSQQKVEFVITLIIVDKLSITSKTPLRNVAQTFLGSNRSFFFNWKDFNLKLFISLEVIHAIQSFSIWNCFFRRCSTQNYLFHSKLSTHNNVFHSKLRFHPSTKLSRPENMSLSSVRDPSLVLTQMVVKKTENSQAFRKTEIFP